MLVESFALPRGKVYMCGHSLGPMPVAASEFVNGALGDLASYGIGSWNKSEWIDLPYILGAKIAGLIGARPEEVVVCDSTVVNLFKVLRVAMELQNDRNVILTTDDNFPADLYIARGVGEVRLVESSTIFDHMHAQIAVLMLTHVNYRDASVLDMGLINDYANKCGILTVWDLSHSIGIVPVDLRESGADFAVGCTYKYLSGGPGSPAFVYANAKHHDLMQSPIQGWMGHDQPFAFKSEYTSSGIKKFIGGTPPILSMKALQAALEIFDLELIARIHAKANEYSAVLIEALRGISMDVYAPQNRGGHVAFIHKHGYGFSRALIDAGFICDYRAPDLVRLCVNPLYLALDDIGACIEQIRSIIKRSLYLRPEYNQVKKVT